MTMRKLLFGATMVAGLATAGAVLAAAPHPCRADLDKVAADFNALGFQDVAKPGQAHVRGAAGHDHTGGQIAYIQSQLRQAYIDCDANQSEAVHAHVAAVRAALKMTHG
jgi:hypothetical protein